MANSKKCSCGLVDIYVLCSVIVGIFGFIITVIQVFHKSSEVDAWRKIYVPSFLGVGSAICLAQALPCWRDRVSSPRISIGYAFILTGNAFGFIICNYWNHIVHNYQQQQLEANDITDLVLPPGPRATNREIASLLVLSGLMGILSLTGEGLRIRNDKEARVSATCCCARSIFLVIVAVCTISLVGLGVLTINPDITEPAEIFVVLIDPPTKNIQPLLVMAALRYGGALSIVMCLLRWWAKSWLSNLFLIVMFLGHGAMIVIGVVKLNLPGQWSVFPEQSTWILFSFSAGLVLLALIANNTCSGRSACTDEAAEFDEDAFTLSSMQYHQRRQQHRPGLYPESVIVDPRPMAQPPPGMYGRPAMPAYGPMYPAQSVYPYGYDAAGPWHG